jgi:phosphohistidine phosphatase SixA
MRLYLIRHADAAPPGDGGVTDDHDRPLTELGHAQARALAVLKKRDVKLDQIVSSPLVRARQTAEDLHQAWEGTLRDVVLCDHLAPGGKRKKLSKFLRDLKAESVAAVGHMPDLSDYLTWLLGSRKAKVPLEKAGVACLECGPDLDKGDAVLLWLVTPGWCE